jgi:hypothetical protein
LSKIKLLAEKAQKPYRFPQKKSIFTYNGLFRQQYGIWQQGKPRPSAGGFGMLFLN